MVRKIGGSDGIGACNRLRRLFAGGKPKRHKSGKPNQFFHVGFS